MTERPTAEELEQLRMVVSNDAQPTASFWRFMAPKLLIAAEEAERFWQAILEHKISIVECGEDGDEIDHKLWEAIK